MRCPLLAGPSLRAGAAPWAGRGGRGWRQGRRGLQPEPALRRPLHAGGAAGAGHGQPGQGAHGQDMRAARCGEAGVCTP